MGSPLGQHSLLVSQWLGTSFPSANDSSVLSKGICMRTEANLLQAVFTSAFTFIHASFHQGQPDMSKKLGLSSVFLHICTTYTCAWILSNIWGFSKPSKITADGDCSHEIKRCLLLRRKAMTKLDSILKSRDVTLLTKVCLVKAMVFPVFMYGCESWTIKKAER